MDCRGLAGLRRDGDTALDADGNDGDRFRIFDENNAPIANSKPATVGTLEPFYVTGSFDRIDRQFAVDLLRDIG